jgi:tetratricopeptide (TPR) repeat protein
MPQIEGWCKEKLDMSKPDSRWHSQMALVLTGFGKRAEARQRCQDALKIEENNWRASLLLANIIESREDGIKILKRLVKKYGNDTGWLKEHDEDFSNMAYGLGGLYWKDQRPEKAIEWFSVSLEHGPVRPDLVFQIMTKYQSDERWDEIMSIIEKLHTKSHLEFVMIAAPNSPWRDNVYLAIRQAVSKTKKFTVFDHVYQPAIEYAKETRKHLVSFDLRQTYASALSACPPPELTRSGTC